MILKPRCQEQAAKERTAKARGEEKKVKSKETKDREALIESVNFNAGYAKIHNLPWDSR